MADPTTRSTFGPRLAGGLKRHAGPLGLPVLIGAGLIHFGQMARGLTIVSLGLIFFLIRLLTGHRLDRLATRVVDAVGTAVTAVALAVVFVVAVVPGWLLGRVVPRRHRGERGWRPHPTGTDDAAYTYSASRLPPRPPAVRLVSGAFVAIGLLTMVVGIDLLAGSLTGVSSHAGPKVLGRLMRGEHGLRISSVVADAPALRGEPWAAENTAELRRIQFEYWPLLAFRTRPFVGRTVSTDGWVRASGEAPALARPAPVVALFGGSIVFGTGQRNDHTIASELAVVARRAGRPIVVANNGQPGWTLWQSWMRFEENSASATAPDIGVFLSGSEEALATPPEPNVPSHVGYLLLRAEMSGAVPAPSSQPTGLAQALYREYLRRSFVHRLWKDVAGSQPAGASIPPPVIPRPPTAPEVAGVYDRALALASSVGLRRHIPTVFVWQPINRTETVARAAAAKVGKPTFDLSRLLDGEHDVFLPDGSVNERGAHIVAEALWPLVRPSVEAWYRKHP